jgi:hypothetical protein
MSGPKILAAIVSIVVIAAVAAAISLDPPSKQRLRKFDAKRTQDLQEISNQINIYWKKNNSLPANLTLLNQPGIRLSLNDPETNELYGYELKNPQSFKLCAVFAFDSADEKQNYYYSTNWAHGPGKYCFDLTAPEEKPAPRPPIFQPKAK